MVDIKSRILLPEKIYALEGMELNIYFENLCLPSPDMYVMDVNSEKGIHMEKYWRYTAVSEEETPVTFSRLDYDCNVLNSKSCKVISCGKNNKPKNNIKCLFIGDSLTYNMAYTQMILNLANSDSVNIELVGTHGYKHKNTALKSNMHEGYGGWALKTHYENQESPFVFNGQFDFQKYMEHNGFDKVDFVFFFLGPNDIVRMQNDEEINDLCEYNCKTYDKIIKNIHAFDNGIHIGIATMLPPSKSQDSFGFSYGCRFKRHRYIRNTHVYNMHMIEAFDNKIDNVGIVPLHVMFDTENNVSWDERKPNARAKSTVRLQNNAVHPSDEGYAQIADGFYFYIRNMSAVK